MTEINIEPKAPVVITVGPANQSPATTSTIVVDSSRGGAVGPQGPQGAQGDQGPPGPTLAYTHTQNVPSTIWSISHGLGIYPQVSCVEFGGSNIEGEVTYTSPNTLTITFSGTVSGYAYIS